MIPLLSRAAVRALDEQAVARGVPGLVLMENAGIAATEAIVRRFGDRLDRVVLVGGGGQNGGDVWVVARQLIVRGFAPRTIVVSSDTLGIGGDAKVNLDALDGLVSQVDGATLEKIAPDAFAALELEASLVVEGLFGTGLDRPIEGGYADVVRRLDEVRAPLVSLDLPSGIDADTGQVLGVAPRAALTVTFGAHKRGLHQFPAVEHAGEVVLGTIGVAPPSDADAGLIEDSDVARVVKRRARDAHKGTAGHVVVVAGAPGTAGAALLCSRAAMRAGAGLVTLATRSPNIDARVWEIMSASLGEEPSDAVALVAEKATAAVVGPGLGTDDEGLELARALALESERPMVLDADALTAFAGDLQALKDAAGPRVLTPHPGEAGRLLGVSSGEVQSDRYGAAAELAKTSGQVVVLKGARTVVSDGERFRVCPAGTPALGVGGTGDVLAGVCGALLCEGRDPFDAAWAAVHLHARAGERAATADRGLFAREVADALPATLASLR